jgi:hypothetical protein
MVRLSVIPPGQACEMAMGASCIALHAMPPIADGKSRVSECNGKPRPVAGEAGQLLQCSTKTFLRTAVLPRASLSQAISLLVRRAARPRGSQKNRSPTSTGICLADVTIGALSVRYRL